MAVVDAISRAKKIGTRGRFRDVPTDPIVITRVLRLP
jgi:hypothetical protein